MVLSKSPVSSQTANGYNSIESAKNNPPSNLVTFGFDKFAKTYIFSADADLDIKTDFGSLRFLQKYRGTGNMMQINIPKFDTTYKDTVIVRDTITNKDTTIIKDTMRIRNLSYSENHIQFRDDETMFLQFTYPLTKSFSLLSKNNLIYSNNTRAIGLNELQRYNFLGGFRYEPVSKSYIEFAGGYENNKQLDFKSNGSIYNLQSGISEYKIFNFSLEGNVAAEYSTLNHSRKNSDIDIYLNAGTYDDPKNMLNFILKYKLLNRDFLSTSVSEPLPFTPIESRFENRLLPILNLSANLIDNLVTNINVSVDNSYINNSYKTAITDLAQSKVRRERHDFIFGFTGDLKYESKSYSQNIGISFNTQNEKNSVYKLFNISDDDVKLIRDLDYQRDYDQSVTRLFAKSLIVPSQIDSLNVNFSISLLQKNTPSLENNDDMDEQSTMGNINYSHRFSTDFSGYFGADLQMTHRVFIKAQRSSENNWNRSLQLASGFSWRTRWFEINPKFSIMASYYTKDSEDTLSPTKSYSNRQIWYRDTITIILYRDLSLQGKVSFSYTERGTFYWRTFSESPQNKNLEYYTTILAFTSINSSINFGFGVRMYKLNRNYSLGPQCVARAIFSDGSSISLQGWYEFQYINNNVKYEIPNLFLMANIRI